MRPSLLFKLGKKATAPATRHRLTAASQKIAYIFAEIEKSRAELQALRTKLAATNAAIDQQLQMNAMMYGGYGLPN